MFLERLRDLNLASSYRTGTANFVHDFVAPCLAHSRRYDRGVGYFSSSWINVVGRPLNDFWARGGIARVVASPALAPRDYETLKDLTLRANTESDLPLSSLGQLLKSTKVELRLARLRAGGSGIYHEKVGIFSDDHDFVAFSGSLNETYNAFLRNYELIHVFCSWREREQLIALEIKTHFTSLWNNTHAVVEVKPFAQALDWVNQAVHAQTAEVDDPENGSDPTDPRDSMSEASVPPPLGPPQGLHLRPHQIAAVTAWLDGRMQGILQMATGSGKTIAALTAAALLANRAPQLLIVVTCPFTHLVDQWESESAKFGFTPIKCYGSYRSWIQELSRLLGLLSRGSLRFVLTVVTHSTFEGDKFQAAIRAYEGPALIIGDEVHGLATPSQLRTLSQGHDFRYRMGLSATPQRHFDDGSTSALFAYFGPVVFEFNLREALKEGVLVPYSYFPEIVQLTEDERGAYLEISRRLASQMGSGGLRNNPQVSLLLFRRARLIAGAQNKLIHLRKLIEEDQKENGPLSHTLIYCGDGTVETDTDDPNPDERRYIGEVADMLGVGFGIRCSIYVAETKLKDRIRMHTQLATREIQAIAAIRCLDEGVDIPSVRTAYILASSRNPRQFIQRRGRVLRRDEASGKTHA